MSNQTVSHIPQGLHPITTQLVVKGAAKLAKQLEAAFGAELLHSMPGANGGIMHGAVKVGEGTIFISDATEFATPTAANTFVYFKDVDAVYAKAQKAGLKVLAPLTTMFWGDRWALLADDFGNQWQIATHVEDLSPDEIKRRMAAQPKQ